MNIQISEVTFAAKPKVHIKRKAIKNLQKKQAELIEQNKMLKASFDAMGISLKKVTPLSYDHPDAQKVSELYRLKFDLQYNAFNGSYKSYKNAKIKYAKAAVQNFQLLPYVNNPIQGDIYLFSKMGRNFMKNQFLDMFRVKTKEEKEFMAMVKAEKAKNTFKTSIGIH